MEIIIFAMQGFVKTGNNMFKAWKTGTSISIAYLCLLLCPYLLARVHELVWHGTWWTREDSCFGSGPDHSSGICDWEGRGHSELWKKNHLWLLLSEEGNDHCPHLQGHVLPCPPVRAKEGRQEFTCNWVEIKFNVTGLILEIEIWSKFFSLIEFLLWILEMFLY